MVIGVPKEIKNNENRVALTPAGVSELRKHKNKVLIEVDAGIGSGISNDEYEKAGATMISEAEAVYRQAELIIKVKEPILQEYDRLQEGQSVFTYLHLAANPELMKVLIAKKITAIAYETVQLTDGSLPLLRPMSEVAGRMSTQIGANLLQKYNGGMGILLGGVPGVPPAKVVIVGGGTVGLNATKMAVGLGASVTVIDVNAERLAYIDDIFSGRVETLYSNEYNIAQSVEKADLLIGAVLIPGAKAPKLVSEEMVRRMKKGSVVVDVAIDQGGSIATIDRVTTHDSPCYEKYGVLHYSVANMPGAVPRTSTYALTGVTLPYIVDLANKGVSRALQENEALQRGLNTYQGYCTYRQIATDLGYEYKEMIHNKMKWL